MEKRNEKKLKTLRTDNVLKFLSNEFKDYCSKEGIHRHLTVRGMPQQNGLAERMNCTLFERIRCLMSNANMPKCFWEEALMTATHLVNRSPSLVIEFKKSIEKWTSHVSDLSSLKVFGYVAHAHSREGRLDHKAKKCLYSLDILQKLKGYHLWCIEEGEGKCIISCDVTFDE